ncbi:MAG: RNA polymerase-binding transcription factor DksA [Phycisphaerae bacterium]|nr:RNA polymerase-binding transcription factor DksA [Phycisphaerae bacterium]
MAKASKTAKKTVKKATRGKSAPPKASKPAAAKSGRKGASPADAGSKSAAKPAARKLPRNAGLTRKELSHFRDLLLNKRATLLGDVSSMTAEALGKNRQDASGDLSNMPIHMADIGSDNYEQEFTLGLLESERTLLRQIDQALERMNRGTYGICLGTGEAISKVRLEAKPWAKYNIEYARLVERGLAADIDVNGSAGDDEDGEDDDDDAGDEEE